MKRRLCLSIMAAIILSLVIPICGAPAAKAATKVGKASMPEFVQLWPWADTIYFEDIHFARNAKYMQVYLRTTGKKVKTVKKSSAAYRKYKKNKSKYIIVKAKRKNRYNVYKAGKWQLILTTSKTTAERQKKLKPNKVYQIKFRGKNGKKVGKSSKILQFRNVSKQLRKQYVESYNEGIKKELEDVEYWKGQLDQPDDEDSDWTNEEHYDYAQYCYEKAAIIYGHALYISETILGWPARDDYMSIYSRSEYDIYGKLI